MPNTTKSRADLKSYFVKNAVPTAGNFADLIDGQLNQSDDGVFKLAGEPLSVVAAGGEQKRVLRLYSQYPATNPDWLISLKPAQDPGNAATNRPGFGLADGAGNTRLFLDATGKLGLGTNDPQGAIDVRIAGSADPWQRFVVTTSSAWGDTNVKYVTIGAGGATGIMFANPYVPWYAADGRASIRYGRAGGNANDTWWDVGARADGSFSFHAADNGGVQNALVVRKNGDLQVLGAATMASATVQGAATIQGVATMASATVQGAATMASATIQGTATIQGLATLSGGLRFSTTIANHIEEDGALYRKDNQCYLTVDDNLYFRKTSSGNNWAAQLRTDTGDLTLKGGLTVQGTATIQGATTMASATIQGTTTIQGAATMASATIQGAATMASATITDSLTITNSLTIPNSLKIDATGKLGLGTSNPQGALDVRIDGSTDAWKRFVVNATPAWGDPNVSYVTIGAGGAAGIMLANPHVPWYAADARASIRYGRAGGRAGDTFWDVGARNDGSFSFHAFESGGVQNALIVNKNGDVQVHGTATIQGTATMQGAATMQGGATIQGITNVSALRFDSGTDNHIEADGALYRKGGECYLTADNNLYFRKTGATGDNVAAWLRTDNGDLSVKGSLYVGRDVNAPSGGDWVFQPEGNKLYIRYVVRTATATTVYTVARFSTSQDRFNVFKDCNGIGPYFFYNDSNNANTFTGTNAPP